MNVREGVRRLGIMLVACGAILGFIVGFSSSEAPWKIAAEHRRFESLMKSPTMRRVTNGANGLRADLSRSRCDAFGLRELGGLYLLKAHPLIQGNADRIKGVHLDVARAVVSIQLSTGESIHRVAAPPLMSYIVLVVCLILSYLLPSGITWVRSGFFAPQQQKSAQSNSPECHQ